MGAYQEENTMFNLDQKVCRKNYAYIPNRIGKVIEIKGDRVRVLWDGVPGAEYMADRPKRTWIKMDSLFKV